MSSKVILKAEDLDGYLTEKDQEYLSKLDKLYDEAMESFKVLSAGGFSSTMATEEKKIISFTFTEQINPIGKPITTPVNPQKTPAKIKDKAIPDEDAPILFNIAISFLRSITSITIADAMLIEATRTIKIIIKINIIFVEEKFWNCATFNSFHL